MTVRAVKFRGAQGDWTVSVDGERLPVVSDVWFTPPHAYFDPMDGANITGKRYADYVEALRSKDRVVMQKTAGDGDFTRRGYIGVFRFTGLDVDESTGAIGMKLVERLPLKPAG